MCRLTREQSDRQDFVDSTIQKMIDALVPESMRGRHDISVLAKVRDLLVYEYALDLETFYPFFYVEV
jgi:hypothetical protein